MKFIKVTDKDSNELELIPLSRVLEVLLDQDGKVFFVMSFDKRGDRRGFYVKESFFEIEEQLRKVGAL